jgi:sugar (pentulose or hexulose) kinase
MNRIPVIVIFDVGKTNKKLLLFDEQYKMVHEESKQLEETKDEDGFVCEDVDVLTEWIKGSFEEITKDKRFNIKAVNFSAYGASFVYVGKEGKVIAPLYNYLKPYPEKLKRRFYQSYGATDIFAGQTASPVLGSLNSGLQIYRIKNEKPELFKRIRFALHLPQYISYIFTGYPATDITSIGCHTGLWNFNEHTYHRWVIREGIVHFFAPITPCSAVIPFNCSNRNYIAGCGLHDSSAALIPYLASFNEPFILLSTGTWCITLNPFDHSPLTDSELQQDCLCFLSYTGKPVKASRLFLGYEHEEQEKKIAAFFNKPSDYYRSVQFDLQILNDTGLENTNPDKPFNDTRMRRPAFDARDLNQFACYEAAYHQLIAGIIREQIQSINLVLKEAAIKRIFVDGGFSNNAVYMHLLAASYPDMGVYAATVPQASALGAALAVHRHWNSKPLPPDIIELKCKI